MPKATQRRSTKRSDPPIVYWRYACGLFSVALVGMNYRNRDATVTLVRTSMTLPICNTTTMSTHLDHSTSLDAPHLTTADSTTNTTNTPAIGNTTSHFYCLCPTRTRNCNREFCDTILTFQEENYAYNLPSSSWTSARNAMYHLAREKRRWAELEGRIPEERHVCFMDGDSNLAIDKPALLEQLAHETEMNKIVVFNYRKGYGGVKYMYCADANVNCFPGQAMDRYLPYSTLLEHEAWSLSQRDLAMRANIQEPFAFKMYDHVPVWNPEHNKEYPRGEEHGSLVLREAQTKDQGFSEGCFPTDTTPGAVHECSLHGKVLFHTTFNKTHKFPVYCGGVN